MGARAVSILAAAAAVLVAASLAGGGAGVAAQSTSECTQTLIGMSPCLNYITGNETAPSRSCCSQLATVARSQPQCLCVALNIDPASLGLGNVNRTRALGLPEQCDVKTPAVSNCNNGTAAPTSPPAGQTPTSGGTGSKSTPTADVGSGGLSLRGSAGLVASFVVAAVYAVSVL